MSKFRMPDSASKAEFVKQNFNLISKKYDTFNDLNSFFLHRLWKNQIVKQIQIFFPIQEIICLDLCCGTGDIALRISSLKNVKKVYGVDFSENMLAIARERNLKNSKVEFLQGDATDLNQFANNSLDVVTIGFGLRNVDDLNKTLSEIYRVLKQNGLFLNLDVGKVKNPFIRVFADFYFFKIVPLIGYILWGGRNEMFDYLPISSLYYPDQEKLKSILEQHGFKKVFYKNFVFGNATLHIAQKT